MALIGYTITVVAKQDNPYNVLPETDISIRKNSDNTLVNIYADEAGLIPIAQLGAKTDSNGQFTFYADASSGVLKAVWTNGGVIATEILDQNDHSKLANRNAVGAHDAIYARGLSTIVELRSFEPTVSGQKINILGHTIQGVGGGEFYYDSTDTSSADNNGTVVVTPSGRRWKRIYSGNVTPAMFNDDINRAFEDHPTVEVPFGYTHNADTGIILTGGKTLILNGTMTNIGLGTSELNPDDFWVTISGENNKIIGSGLMLGSFNHGNLYHIALRGASNTVIEGICGKNFGTAFISLYDGVNVDTKILNVTGVGGGYSVLGKELMSSGSKGLLISGLIHDGGNSGYRGDGVEINTPINRFSDIVVTGCIVRDCQGGTATLPIQDFNAGLGYGFAQCDNILIAECIALDCDGDGFHVEYSNDVHIVNCISDGTGIKSVVPDQYTGSGLSNIFNNNFKAENITIKNVDFDYAIICYASFSDPTKIYRGMILRDITTDTYTRGCISLQGQDDFLIDGLFSYNGNTGNEDVFGGAKWPFINFTDWSTAAPCSNGHLRNISVISAANAHGPSFADSSPESGSHIQNISFTDCNLELCDSPVKYLTSYTRVSRLKIGVDNLYGGGTLLAGTNNAFVANDNMRGYTRVSATSTSGGNLVIKSAEPVNGGFNLYYDLLSEDATFVYDIL